MTEKVKSMERAKEALSGGVEKTKAGLETAKGKIVEVSDGVKTQAGMAGAFAKDRAGFAAEGLRDGYGKARKDLDKLAADVTVYVRDNPGRAVVMAGALGFFLGFLIRGERRR